MSVRYVPSASQHYCYPLIYIDISLYNHSPDASGPVYFSQFFAPILDVTNLKVVYLGLRVVF
jgi:hypothetical protein